MNFDYNEEQQLLADSVRRFLAKDYGFEARKKIVDSKDGWSSGVWAQLTEMGLMGLPFSPDYGGFGGGAVDLMGVMEAAGDAMLVEPYLPTLMAGFAVARAGSDAQKKAILTAVVEGKLKLAFAQTEKGARYNLTKVDAQAKKAGSGWELTGEKFVVLGAPAADAFVVSANTDKGLSLFLVKKESVKVKAYVTLDEQRAGDVSLAKSPAEMLGAEGGALAVIEETVDLRRSGGRDEVRLRHHARIPEDAQAVRRADRYLPGAAAPHGQHVRRPGAGALDGLPRLQQGGFPGKCQGPGEGDIGCEDQDRGQRASHQPGSDPAARRHGHDRGDEGQPYLPAAHDDRAAIRRCRSPSRALCCAVLAILLLKLNS